MEQSRPHRRIWLLRDEYRVAFRNSNYTIYRRIGEERAGCTNWRGLMSVIIGSYFRASVRTPAAGLSSAP